MTTYMQKEYEAALELEERDVLNEVVLKYKNLQFKSLKRISLTFCFVKT